MRVDPEYVYTYIVNGEAWYAQTLPPVSRLDGVIDRLGFADITQRAQGLPVSLPA